MVHHSLSVEDILDRFLIVGLFTTEYLHIPKIRYGIIKCFKCLKIDYSVQGAKIMTKNCKRDMLYYCAIF